VVLKKATYTVSVNVTGGSVSPTSAQVEHGKSGTFTITPSEGYTLEEAIVSGSGCTLSESVLTASNVVSNITCSVVLKELSKLLKDRILASHTVRPGSRPNLNNGVFQDNNTKTLYTASGNLTEDINGDGVGETVYYFAGNALDNWVYFAGIYWRIIRINEDESVRLLYVGPDKNTEKGYINEKTVNYNNDYIDPAYVGYMYGITGSLKNSRRNTTNSTIKTAIDLWYDDTIESNYDGYVSKTAIYCNDRANEGYSLNSFQFAANKRLVAAKSPSYRCGNDANGNLYTGENGADIADKFTASTSTGNGKLTNPAALMTADELSFAGAIYSRSATAYYVYNAAGTSVIKRPYWWTMSPYYYNTVSGAGMFFIDGSNGTIALNIVGKEYAVRPVLSLKSCVKWKSGDGTSDNPYKVDNLDSTCSSAEN